MVAPRGMRLGEAVRIPDEREANTLYNKGMFGMPVSGGGLDLTLIEALYLVDAGRLVVADEDAFSLLAAGAAADAEFDLRFVAYRDLRNRTFIVRQDKAGRFHLYPRGSLPGRTASSHLIEAVSERSQLDAAALLTRVDEARAQSKRLLVVLVDEEGDITYYDVKRAEPRAGVPALPTLPATGRFEAELLGERVILRDSALYDEAFFGRDLGVAHHLSLPEAVYLARAGCLALSGIADAEALAARAVAAEPDFELRCVAYADLRARGLVVKTGFKFGTHFRLYTGSPAEQHAPFLVHVLPAASMVAWPEVCGFVRLAHAVRKRLLFAVPGGGAGDDDATRGAFGYLEFSRAKP